MPSIAAALTAFTVITRLGVPRVGVVGENHSPVAFGTPVKQDQLGHV